MGLALNQFDRVGRYVATEPPVTSALDGVDPQWMGQTVSTGTDHVPDYQPDCYLCPGNARSSGAVNPDYRGVYVFDNDHPCVGDNAPAELEHLQGPYVSRRADGTARVVCYAPRHDLTLARMPLPDIRAVVETWQRETRDLGARPEVQQVLIFENKGAVVGVSNPHPHGQIYATNFTWKTFDTELEAQRRYARDTGRALFADRSVLPVFAARLAVAASCASDSRSNPTAGACHQRPVQRSGYGGQHAASTNRAVR